MQKSHNSYFSFINFENQTKMIINGRGSKIALKEIWPHICIFDIWLIFWWLIFTPIWCFQDQYSPDWEMEWMLKPWSDKTRAKLLWPNPFLYHRNLVNHLPTFVLQASSCMTVEASLIPFLWPLLLFGYYLHKYQIYGKPE